MRTRALRSPPWGRAAATTARPASVAADRAQAAGARSRLDRMAASMTGRCAAADGRTPPVSSPGVDLTIAMPVYNERATVARAIDSVLDAGFSDYELIVVDDGSTDG